LAEFQQKSKKIEVGLAEIWQNSTRIRKKSLSLQRLGEKSRVADALAFISHFTEVA